MARPLNEQIVVITGASSGIGRATALRFGKAGSKVVLAARNVLALQEVVDEIEAAGGEAIAVPTDVSDWEAMKSLADDAMLAYGGIDTWVNDAAVAVYATAEDTTIDEVEQVMHTDFMGVVHGVKAVLPYMKVQGYGTIINLGSVESERALPYHAAYSAAKQAVKAYTDSLRMELENEKANINVTLILPAGINTPFFSHARSKLGVEPQPARPAYSPERVAEAITHAAEHPQRDIYVGGASRMVSAMQRISPALTDRVMTTGGLMFKMQKSNRPAHEYDTMFSTMPEGGRVEGNYGDKVTPDSHTRLFELTPTWVRAVPLVLLVGAIVARGAVRR